MHTPFCRPYYTPPPAPPPVISLSLSRPFLNRSVATCVRKGVAIDSRARQVKQSDFDKFDYIFAMDDANLRNLQNLQPKDGKAKRLSSPPFLSFPFPRCLQAKSTEMRRDLRWAF
jgi:hypothetical protein